MKIARGSLLARLNEAALGLSAKPTVEQSDCFVFSDGKLTTFNGEMMVRVANPLMELCGTPDDPRDIVVTAQDLLQCLAKFPDDEVKITVDEGELVVRGKGRKAGIATAMEAALPTEAVPEPAAWSRLGEGVLNLLQQAARTCGENENAHLTTCVHVTPTRIEACDNKRFFRVDCATGFTKEILIPAETVERLEGVELSKVAVDENAAWVHFKTAAGAVISCQCSHEPYHKGLDAILEIHNGERVVLPGNLKEIVERAEVFHSGEHDAKIGVNLSPGLLVITSRKEGGWFSERREVEYAGRPLHFEINPKFLVEILARTRDVEVDDRKVKIVSDKIQFVASLQLVEEKRTQPEA